MAAFFCVGRFNQLRRNQAKFSVLSERVKALDRQKHELEQKQRALLATRRFLDQAASLGLGRQFWAYYDVNIQETVSFAEMEQILNQCNNSSAAYFKPIALHIKKVTPERPKSAARAVPRPDHSGAVSNTDLSITLSGKFLAKPE